MKRNLSHLIVAEDYAGSLLDGRLGFFDGRLRDFLLSWQGSSFVNFILLGLLQLLLLDSIGVLRRILAFLLLFVALFRLLCSLRFSLRLALFQLLLPLFVQFRLLRLRLQLFESEILSSTPLQIMMTITASRASRRT